VVLDSFPPGVGSATLRDTQDFVLRYKGHKGGADTLPNHRPLLLSSYMRDPPTVLGSDGKPEAESIDWEACDGGPMDCLLCVMPISSRLMPGESSEDWTMRQIALMTSIS
jgi:hypothetical protein